jgi:hypothetical protein
VTLHDIKLGVRDFVRGYLRVSVKSCVGDPTSWEHDYLERRRSLDEQTPQPLNRPATTRERPLASGE